MLAVTSCIGLEVRTRISECMYKFVHAVTPSAKLLGGCECSGSRIHLIADTINRQQHERYDVSLRRTVRL